MLASWCSSMRGGSATRLTFLKMAAIIAQSMGRSSSHACLFNGAATEGCVAGKLFGRQRLASQGRLIDLQQVTRADMSHISGPAWKGTE